jgi:hypothetical protein
LNETLFTSLAQARVALRDLETEFGVKLLSLAARRPSIKY